MNQYDHGADDFYINLNLNTAIELPTGRDTILHYFEQMRKAYPELSHFYRKEGGDFVLEGDKDLPEYRWVAIEPRRLCSGHVNPDRSELAYAQHERVLDMAPHLLSISDLDCEALDVMYGFDFNYVGNHDELVAEALGLGPGLEGMLEVKGSQVLHYEPTITLALEDSCRLQCRLSIETRTNAVQVRTGDFPEEQISVYLAVRQNWGAGPDRSFVDAFRRQREIGEEIMTERVIPRIIRPLAQAIASR